MFPILKPGETSAKGAAPEPGNHAQCLLGAGEAPSGRCGLVWHLLSDTEKGLMKADGQSIVDGELAAFCPGIALLETRHL